MAETDLSDNVIVYFWRTYLEWRAEYGVGDICMGELVAAMQAELQSGALDREEAIRLRRLIQVVEAELMLMRRLDAPGIPGRLSAGSLHEASWISGHN